MMCIENGPSNGCSDHMWLSIEILYGDQDNHPKWVLRVIWLSYIVSYVYKNNYKQPKPTRILNARGIMKAEVTGPGGCHPYLHFRI